MSLPAVIIAQDLNVGELGIENAGDQSDVSLTRNKGAAVIGKSNLPELEKGAGLVKKGDDHILPESVQNLTPQEKAAIQRQLQTAASYIQGIRLQEGLQILFDIEKKSDEIYHTHNLRGAVYTKLRDFPKARRSFNRTLELRPDLLEARFNLAELDFVEKKFPEAEKSFAKLKKDFPDLPASQKKLVDYKIYVALLMQSTAKSDAKERSALQIKDTFDFLGDTPAYYCAEMAHAFKHNQAEKANEWLVSANKIFSSPGDKALLQVYLDALMEVGWMETF